MSFLEKQVAERINRAVAQADTTKSVIIGSNILSQTPACFKNCFGDKDVVIVADRNTYAAAGQTIMDTFISSGKKNISPPLIIEDEGLYAEYGFVKKVEKYLKSIDAVAVAVGSGTINDLVKLASHMCGREYMVVATAASMDGYTSFGASITKDGLKQTMFCLAPVAFVADIDVIEKAPMGMNASGYADLIAKIPAGADWLVADALGIEPIISKAWSIVQPPLRSWIDNPQGIRVNDRNALIKLTEGLIMSGLAMQASQSSRPASGAEHQFSHFWDGQHHTHNGIAPSHGIKVGIGSICSEAMYENILNLEVEDFDTNVEIIKKWWPKWGAIENIIKTCFKDPTLAEQIVQQSEAKYVNAEDLAERLKLLAVVWPDLKDKLRNQLLGAKTIQNMIKIAGAASLPTDIGIDYSALQSTFRNAQLIRKRYTVLDLVLETGMWSRCVDSLFCNKGFWVQKQQKTVRVQTVESSIAQKTTYQKA